MVNKTCCFYSFGTLFLLLGAALIVILGAVLKPYIVDPAIDKGIKDALKIDYNNFNEDDLRKFKLDMKDYDVYYFNVTNLGAVQDNVYNLFGNSAPPVPNVNQVGPYTYRYYEFKEDITLSQSPEGNGVINYRIWWLYNPYVGNNELTDTVCTFNPIYLGALNLAWQSSYYASAPFGADEYLLERQFFAGFATKLASQVVPGVLTKLVPAMAVGLFTAYVQALVNTLIFKLGKDTDTIINVWSSSNSSLYFSNNLPPTLGFPLVGFELDNAKVPGNTFLPGPTLAGRMFTPTSSYNLITSSGWSSWVTLLQLAQANKFTDPAFVTFFVNITADIAKDIVTASGNLLPLQNATIIAAPLSQAFFQRMGAWFNSLTASLTPQTYIFNNSFSAVLFNALNATGYLPAGTFVTWSDFAYSQLASGDFAKLTGLPYPFVTIPAPLTIPVTTPAAIVYPASDKNIHYYGLEIESYGIGKFNRFQLQNFWNDWAVNGTNFYVVTLGVALFPIPTAPLTAREQGVLGYLNTFGFNFSLNDSVVARSQAVIFTDYIATNIVNYIFPVLRQSNTGLFTCRTVREFTKGYVDLGFGGNAFPGFFADTNFNTTGNTRSLYTGLDNVNLARFYYARNGVTTFRSLADLGLAKYCPLSLTTQLPVCHDIWSTTGGYDDKGFNVTIKGSSTFSVFGPDANADKYQAFNNDLLRIVNFTYELDESVKGVKTRRFKLADEMLQGQNDNRVNTGYRMSTGGIAPMKFSSPLWGFSLSRPHFVQAAENTKHTVTGLDTTHDSNYLTNIWIEPMSGAVVKGTKKLQASFHLVSSTFDERLHNRLFQIPTGSEYYWPIFWADERGILNDSQASDFDTIYKAQDVATILSPIGYGVGAGVFVIGLILLYLGCKSGSSGTQLKSTSTL